MVKTVSRRVTLQNRRGLHARASNKFMECAMQFDAEVEVTSHNDIAAQSVVADSVMELLLLGAAYGEDITIRASGKEAEAAVTALAALIADKFDEEC